MRYGSSNKIRGHPDMYVLAVWWFGAISSIPNLSTPNMSAIPNFSQLV